MRAELPVRGHHQVDQRLTADHDHAVAAHGEGA
jgi:hypothetical protein